MITRNALIILIKKQAFSRSGGLADPEEPKAGKAINNSISEQDDLRATTTIEGRYTQIREDQGNLTWEDFNSDMRSSIFDYSEVEDIVNSNQDATIDLRPYMNLRPHMVTDTSTLGRVAELFHMMSLRHLPVVSSYDNSIVGIITRKDIFKYVDYGS